MTVRHLLAIALAASAAITSLAHAAAAGADDTVPPARLQPQAFSGPLKVLKTYHEVGSATMAIPASTITAYGSSQTVNCTASGGCYVMIDAEAQIAPTASVASTAMCLRVDGVSTDVCPFLTLSATGNYTSFSHRGGVAVALGTHTVTTHVYVGTAATLYNFNTKVQLLKQ